MSAVAPLRLRPCVIAGETRPGDYSVVTDDRKAVGRIYRAEEARTET